MRLVISDTGPVNYLIQIGRIDLLPRLFERVILPSAVLTELSHPLAPASVQRWVGAAPAWLEIAESPAVTLFRRNSQRRGCGHRSGLGIPCGPVAHG